MILARFEEGGVLGAMPCWFPPTSRQEDEVTMTEWFRASAAVVQDAIGSDCTPRMPSESMQLALHMFGLFKFTAPSTDSVSVREKVMFPVTSLLESSKLCACVCD